MRKQIAYGASILFSLVATTLGACSSSPNGGGGSDASTTDGKVIPDTGVGNQTDAGGDPACFDPSTVLSFTTAPLPPAANQGKCASDDLVNQFLAACISSVDAGAGTDAGDAGDPCDAFISANSDCALCLGGYTAPDAAAPPNSPWPALLQIDENGNVVPAVAACLAAISTGTDTCKGNYANDDLCVQSGCAACSDTDYSTCATDESTDPTTSCLTQDPLDATCLAAINAVSQTDADSKCAASTTINTDADFAAVFLAVGRTMCE